MFKTPGGARGPHPQPLDEVEAEKLIALLHKGRGRALACKQLRLAYRRFKRRYDDDEEFRGAVRSAERCAQEELEARGYDLAIGGDAEALFKMLARRDRSRALSLARADAAAERDLRRKEQGKSGGWTLADIVKFGIDGMTLAEKQEYLQIVDKQLDGRPLDEAESSSYGRIAMHVLAQLMKAAYRNTAAVP